MHKIHHFKGLRSFLILWSGQAVSSLGTAMIEYALIIWVYTRTGTATSITLLSVCAYAPSILFSFAAGTLADKWDKKKTMLVANAASAVGTATVFALYATGSLQIWPLYVVNFTLGFVSAFQNPASYVAVSQLVPKEQYVRVSGLQGFSRSLVQILAPALATATMAFGGLTTIFVVDLVSFAVVFFALLLFIRIPAVERRSAEEKDTFVERSLEGLKYLKEHKALLQIILYLSLINFLAYTTGFGILPAMILARSGNNRAVLGAVSSAIGIGMLTGSAMVTILKPPRSRTKLMFATLAVSFILGDVLWAIGRCPALWVFAGFAGFVLVPFTNAAMFTIMRAQVPPQMQGRVFSARDTIQYCTIPTGLLVGGVLADRVFGPFMQTASPLQGALSFLVGTGKGSGMAIMFLLTGIAGTLASLRKLRDPIYRELDESL